ncbi:hypothetical protein ABIA16_002262 [Sinorhizobium fredii]
MTWKAPLLAGLLRFASHGEHARAENLPGEPATMTPSASKPVGTSSAEVVLYFFFSRLRTVLTSSGVSSSKCSMIRSGARLAIGTSE